jgi:hypothetical protein
MTENIDPFRDISPEDVVRLLDSNAMGRYNELRVLYAIETLKPWWYAEYSWADDCEDKRGVDLWIRHKIMGWVPFQVKSSRRGLRKHINQSNKHKENGEDSIPCIISNLDNSLSDIVIQIDKGFRFERMKGFFARRRRHFSKFKR